MTLLVDDLEAHGMVPLPAKQVKQAPGQPIPAFQEPPATAPLTDTLAAVAPITTGDIKGEARVLDSLSADLSCIWAYIQLVSATLRVGFKGELR